MKDLNVQYIDNFPSDRPIYTKISYLIELDNSKYCVFCAADDFIIPKAIDKSIEFIEKHPNYTSVSGQTILFWINTSKKK